MGRKCKIMIIKESLECLYRLRNKSTNNMITQRLEMLIECKKHEKDGISKEDLCRLVGCCGQSVVKWREAYAKGGIEMLTSHQRKPNRQPILNEQERKSLEAKLRDADNPCIGYAELVDWVEDNLGKKMKYITLYCYARRNFGTKIKTPRKSHAKKDASAAEDFKKKDSGSNTTR